MPTSISSHAGIPIRSVQLDQVALQNIASAAPEEGSAPSRRSILIDQSLQLHAAQAERAQLRHQLHTATGAERELALRQWADSSAAGYFPLAAEEAELALLDRWTQELAEADRRAELAAGLRDDLQNVVDRHKKLDPALALQVRQAASEAGQAQLSSMSPELMAADVDADDSHYDFFEELFKMLEGLQGDWLDRNQGMLEEYIAFFDRLTGIMAKVAAAVKGEKDGNLQVDTGEILRELDNLMNDSGALGLGGSFKTKAEAEKFLDELGLGGMEVKPDPAGGFQLVIKKGLIDELRSVFDLGAGQREISAARWNAIVAAKDSLMERFNHISKVLTEKYQRTLQLWDTLVKTLSSTVDSVTEADRVFASNLA